MGPNIMGTIICAIVINRRSEQMLLMIIVSIGAVYVFVVFDRILK